jgi:hypothetical protein
VDISLRDPQIEPFPEQSDDLLVGNLTGLLTVATADTVFPSAKDVPSMWQRDLRSECP